MAQSKASRPVVTGVQYRKNKYAAPVGGLFLLLAAIGLVALTIFSVQFTQRMLDNSGEKQRFEQVILPVLMFDPVAFEKPTDLSPEFLLQTSLWATLLGEKRDTYTEDAFGRMIVPASDVDIGCAKLYGPEVKLVHQSIGDYETTYVYNDSTKTYYIPVDGQTGMYTPSVERVVKKGDVYTLTVGYIPPANAYTRMMLGQNEKLPADKYMIYELLKVKNNFQITAIRYTTEGGSGNTQGLPMEFQPPSSTAASSDAQAEEDASQSEETAPPEEGTDSQTSEAKSE